MTEVKQAQSMRIDAVQAENKNATGFLVDDAPALIILRNGVGYRMEIDVATLKGLATSMLAVAEQLEKGGAIQSLAIMPPAGSA